MRVAYSDHSSNHVCGFGSAKSFLHGTNSIEPNLFQHGETTYRVGWLIWICYSCALERRCLQGREERGNHTWNFLLEEIRLFVIYFYIYFLHIFFNGMIRTFAIFEHGHKSLVSSSLGLSSLIWTETDSVLLLWERLHHSIQLEDEY